MGSRDAIAWGGIALLLLLAAHQLNLRPPVATMPAIDSKPKGLEEWTQLIESGRLKGPALAEAYFERSNAYPTGNLDSRMADLSKAIEVDPQQDSALFWRGSYHELQKVHDRAVEDYTKAIAIVAEIVDERRQPTLHSWLWARLVSLHRLRGYSTGMPANTTWQSPTPQSSSSCTPTARSTFGRVGTRRVRSVRKQTRRQAAPTCTSRRASPNKRWRTSAMPLSWIRIGASIGSTSARRS
jgi:tetratricopeptide (TPR) repeat protein